MGDASGKRGRSPWPGNGNSPKRAKRSVTVFAYLSVEGHDGVPFLGELGEVGTDLRYAALREQLFSKFAQDVSAKNGLVGSAVHWALHKLGQEDTVGEAMSPRRETVSNLKLRDNTFAVVIRASSARKEKRAPAALAESWVSYHSIDVNSPACLKRESLVNHIVAHAMPGELVLLKAPPAAGKSALLELVGHEMLQRGRQVYYVRLDWNEDHFDSVQHARVLGEGGSVRSLFDQRKRQWTVGTGAVVLVDECQRLKDPAFFESMLKTQSHPPTAVGASTYELELERRADSPVAARVIAFDSSSAPHIRLTDSESDELYNKYLDLLSGVPKGHDLRRVILGQCNGYAGLIVSSLICLNIEARSKFLTEQAACKLALSHQFVDGFSRVWTSSLTLNADEREIVRRWLLDQSKPMTDATLQARLIKNFYLQLCEQGQLGFNCQLVYRRLLRALFPNQSQAPFTGTIFDLVVAVLEKIPPNRVEQACEGELPLETSLQHLFMIGLCQVLAPNQEVIPEKAGNDKGHMDFFVNGDLCWGLELMRCGDRLTGHASRFEDGGAYHGIAKEFKLVDFWPHNRKPAHFCANRIVVQFTENFGQARVREGDEEWRDCALGRPDE